MQKKQTAIEVKVGALVLFSLALLVGFVLVLGDISFSDGFRFHVEFDNAGGLKPGADVAIAGLNVGTVEKLEFQKEKGQDGSKSGSKSPAVKVQATIRLDEEYADSIREKSEFYISSRGVLGEPYIEIVTPTFDSPPLEEGALVKGVNPPRMDVIVSKASELLETITEMLNDPEVAAKDLIANAASLLGNLDAFLMDNRDDLDQTVVGVRTSATEASKLLEGLNVALDRGRALDEIVADTKRTASNARVITERVRGSVDPVVEDVEKTAANTRAVSESARRLVVDKEDDIAASIDNVKTGTDNFVKMSSDAHDVVSRIENGEGTVGRLLNDRAMYDDMREILRTIKRRPWKIIWKE